MFVFVECGPDAFPGSLRGLGHDLYLVTLLGIAFLTGPLRPLSAVSLAADDRSWCRDDLALLSIALAFP
ncbi:hypothetical protein ACFOM8_07050 [Paracoccus angustae]|uniref:Uncharacterized protein n=1 Tax=Paracoccus angustae TaxID=1671480 RepID=A0ABV7U2E0_9RHOB